MAETIEIHRIEPFRAAQASGAIAGIWAQANGADDAMANAFAQGTFPKHVGWPGFQLDIAAVEGHPVGLIYGYRTLPGQWWHDEVAPALTNAGKESWLDDAMELAEIAVLPAFQGRGIGSRLMAAFLADQTRRVVLALEESDTTTHDLYKRFGFVDLLDNFTYTGFDEPIIVMGRNPD